MRVAGLVGLASRRLRGRTLRLGGIQARMLLLLAVAAIPLVALSGTLAWRDYETARRDVIISAKLTREAAVAERRAALFATEHLLRVLAARTALGTPGFSQTDCNAALDTAMSLDPEAYGALLVFDAAGKLMCAPSPPPPAALVAALGRLGGRVRADARPLIDAFTIDGGPESRLAIAVPITGPAGLAGAVVACVRLDQLVTMMHAGLADGALVWLIGPEGAGSDYGALAGPALPADPAVLEQARDRGLIARARDGALTSYASQMLAGGLVVLAGYRAEADLAAARHVLISRLAILAALLGIGFLLTGAGIHQYVIRPLKDLAGAVRRWRGGGAFIAAPPAGMPTEVAELSLAFRDATRRLAEREAQVRAALEERDLVMQEIHHRVKNNLQIVASLLNLQAGRIRQPEARVRAWRSAPHQHAQLPDRAVRPAVRGDGRDRGRPHHAVDRGERTGNGQRPGGAAGADRDRDGQQRAEIRLSSASARACLRHADHRGRAHCPADGGGRRRRPAGGSVGDRHRHT